MSSSGISVKLLRQCVSNAYGLVQAEHIQKYHPYGIIPCEETTTIDVNATLGGVLKEKGIIAGGITLSSKIDLRSKIKEFEGNPEIQFYMTNNNSVLEKSSGYDFAWYAKLVSDLGKPFLYRAFFQAKQLKPNAKVTASRTTYTWEQDYLSGLGLKCVPENNSSQVKIQPVNFIYDNVQLITFMEHVKAEQLANPDVVTEGFYIIYTAGGACTINIEHLRQALACLVRAKITSVTGQNVALTQLFLPSKEPANMLLNDEDPFFKSYKKAEVTDSDSRSIGDIFSDLEKMRKGSAEKEEVDWDAYEE